MADGVAELVADFEKKMAPVRAAQQAVVERVTASLAGQLAAVGRRGLRD
jgi:hypothetical protein